MIYSGGASVRRATANDTALPPAGPDPALGEHMGRKTDLIMTAAAASNTLDVTILGTARPGVCLKTAIRDREGAKDTKHRRGAAACGHGFIPFVLTDRGGWGPRARAVLHELGMMTRHSATPFWDTGMRNSFEEYFYARLGIICNRWGFWSHHLSVTPKGHDRGGSLRLQGSAPDIAIWMQRSRRGMHMSFV